MILSNDGLIAFHYRSYGTFFLQQNSLHNIHREFTHYKYYRANYKALLSNDASVTFILEKIINRLDLVVY